MQDFERIRSRQARVSGEVDLAHPSGTKESQDCVFGDGFTNCRRHARMVARTTSFRRNWVYYHEQVLVRASGSATRRCWCGEVFRWLGSAGAARGADGRANDLLVRMPTVRAQSNE